MICKDESELKIHGTNVNGVSVHWLKEGFLKEVREAGLNENDPIYKIEDLSDPIKYGVIRSKGKDLVCPHDGEVGAAYVVCVRGDNNFGMATEMPSYG